MKRRRKAQRGVVLLMVISLLVLFILIAVTFAVVAGQYRQAAQVQVNVEATGDAPRKDLDMVMNIALRDTVPGTTLFNHSLLGDRYGHQGSIFGAVGNTVLAEAGGQFIHLQFLPQGIPVLQAGYYNGNVLTFLTGAAMGNSTRIVGYVPPTYDAMGNLQTPGELRFESTDNDGNAIPLPATNDRLLINGHEFNGSGPGYDPSTNNIDSVVPIVPGITGLSTSPFLTSLLPNYGAYLSSPQTTAGAPVPTTADVGGMDESFDVPSFHDMFLAYLPSVTDAATQISLPSFHRPDLIYYWYTVVAGSQLMAGLTPAEQILVFNYPYGLDGIPNSTDDNSAPWTTVNTNGTSMGIAPPATGCQLIARLKRYITLRPLLQDHPNFTGSNSAFLHVGNTLAGSNPVSLDPTSLVWDVDNDGDGVPDSIWIDPGLPVATTPEGRRYKKLFAIMIRDLDGRVNINAAGALAQLGAGYTNQVTGPVAGAASPPGTQSVALPRGIGVGPADLNFNSLFPSAGVYNAIVTGRYGADGLPGNATDDTLSWLKSIGIPDNYAAGPAAYGSPPDLSGQGAIAVDHFGQPLSGFMGQNGETTNDPYEFDPVRGSSQDARYTLGELERVLRYNDSDVDSLPQRLVQSNAANDLANVRVRRAITTHSSHSALPSVQLPTEARTGAVPWAAGPPNQYLINRNSPTLLDVFQARLQHGLRTAATPAIPANQVPARVTLELQRVVPFEILHGQPLDLNRWFGNGLDDNGNGAVDEFNEELTGETIWNGTPPAGFAGVTFSYGNDTPGATDPRQLFARHLYCLARAVMDDQYQWPPLATSNDGAILNNATLRQQFVYHRLAQWAINVVEFRDRDAIMTPFEYDINPWNGWVCDGNPNTDEGTDGVDNDGDGQIDEVDERERFLVWGTEFPDLLISETLAFHDRRVRDTNYDAAPATPQFRWDSGPMRWRDDDLDQYRKPEGSGFLEVYCPRNFAANNAAFPLELYDASGNLDLGRLAPSRTFGMGGQQARHPVWRAVVTETPPAVPNGQTIQFLGQNSNPDTAVYEPAVLGGGRPIERIMWFTPHDPANIPTNDAPRVFYGRTGSLSANPNSVPAPQQVGSNVVLPPNRHLVVGPRPVTALGSLVNGPDGNPDTLDVSIHQIRITGTVFSIVGGFYSAAFGYPLALPAMGAVIPTPLGIVCAAKPPAGWANQNAQIGFNVSEPLPQSGNYYQEPGYPNDLYADLQNPHNPLTNAFPDTPFDGAPGTPLANKIRTGTYVGHRAVYLQRLANPLLPWNPDPNDPEFGGYFDANLLLNPYVTIDWSSFDLTVFSGNQLNRQRTDAVTNSQEWEDPSDPDPYSPAGGVTERFGARERGIASAVAPTTDNLWSPFSTTPAVSAQQTGDLDHYFNLRLTTTLGYLNTRYGTPRAPLSGYEGTPYVGATPNPFPWLTFNNRPFANPLELMMVPASAPSRLGLEVSKWNAPVWNPYHDPRQAFGHLLNFFQTSTAPPAVTGTASPEVAPTALGAAPQLYRLFDYVETPSMFVGAERWYNATTFATDPNAISFRPPYNRLSRFREPGRMNANTIADEFEWAAAQGTFANYLATSGLSHWQTVQRSREGRFVTGVANYPTIFANPFRSAGSADLMPNVAGMRRAGPEATLLRSLPPPGSTAANPLTGANPTSSNDPQFRLNYANAYQNSDRNAYFRYQGINRLSNLLTTHSNVFAVWITEGYFEVEDNPNPMGAADEAHPDGLRLGPEIGLDSGTAVRHRAFYIIDRSVPVAFERGQNHNVDRAVLLRRYIE